RLRTGFVAGDDNLCHPGFFSGDEDLGWRNRPAMNDVRVSHFNVKLVAGHSQRDDGALSRVELEAALVVHATGNEMLTCLRGIVSLGRSVLCACAASHHG